VALVEGERPAERRTSAHGVGLRDGLHQSFLFLPVGSRVGSGLLEDQGLRSIPIGLWLNGHSWAKRQLEKVGIAYEALDNGFRSCADPAALQRICNRLGPNALHPFFWRWFHRLPSPFTPNDLQAGTTISWPSATSTCPTRACSTALRRPGVLRGRDPRQAGSGSAGQGGAAL
jgi:hypothetical protein